MPSVTVLTSEGSVLMVPPALPVNPATTLPVTDLGALTITTQNLEIARLKAGIEAAHALVTSALRDLDRHPHDAKRQMLSLETVLGAARLDPYASVALERRHASDPGQSAGACPNCGGDLYPGGTLCKTVQGPRRVWGVMCVCEDCGEPKLVQDDGEEGPQ